MLHSDNSKWFTAELAPHEQALRAYLRGLVKPSEIDDIVQETYVRLLRARDRGNIVSPRGLLFATARNAARDLFRRRTTANTISVTEIDEARVIEPGGQPVTFDLPARDGHTWRVGLSVCYDLRFPELFRKMALEGAEIVCLPAEWPKPRQEHWRTLLRARAMENQLFLIATNCCGVQGKLDFFGMSLLLSARGEVLAEGGETDTELIATFDAQEMIDYRAQIRCYHDRRPEIYGTLL